MWGCDFSLNIESFIGKESGAPDSLLYIGCNKIVPNNVGLFVI